MPETKKYLNRDGLEEYNSLLPHSSTEIQEYVDDWLDAHPEATTTVPDDGITTRKLADGSVTRNKLAADVAHLLGGMMVTGEVQGEILSADDAYSVAPLSMEIDGKSSQNGTPTPDAPVPIQSIEVLELDLTFASKNLFDKNSDKLGYYDANGSFHSSTIYKWWSVSVSIGDTLRYQNSSDCRMTYWKDGVCTGYAPQTSTATHLVTESDNCDEIRGYCSNSAWDTCIVTLNNPNMSYQSYERISASVPMQGHVLRSLPDGTHDTMSLSYLHESDRAGWAWYSMEVVQAVGHVEDMGELRWSYSSNYMMFNPTLANIRPSAPEQVSLICTGYAGFGNRVIGYLTNNMPDKHVSLRANYGTLWLKDNDYTDATLFTAAVAGMQLDYPLATPITTTLDPIELPVLPAPNCTVWSDPSTGLKMSYMRDVSIVVSNIEQAIADL